MATNDDYIGREQSLVKHYILRYYLERFAHIIGTKWDTITYVDCFSGPWESKAPDLSDTSFAIALAELRKARATLAARNKSLGIRCLFLEEKAKAHARLKAYADRQSDVAVETKKAAMLDSLPAILAFLQAGGKNSFSFVFIDPTGWKGFDLDRIAPLLQHAPGEVLVNVMTEHIRRFLDDKRPKIRDSIRRCFGTDEVFARLKKMYGDDFREKNPQEVEDELFTSYARQLRTAGPFPYTCPAVVLHPSVDRTYFHLIYATRHRKGVEVFKDVEKAAYPVQERIRAAAEERAAVKKTQQPSLFASEVEQPPSPRATMLRRRYLTAALKCIEELRGDRKRVPYDEIWDAAMAFPLVWASDVKDWIAEWKRTGRVRVLGLKPKQRVPQWEMGHEIEFLK